MVTSNVVTAKIGARIITRNSADAITMYTPMKWKRIKINAAIWKMNCRKRRWILLTMRRGIMPNFKEADPFLLRRLGTLLGVLQSHLHLLNVKLLFFSYQSAG